jgi:hypothetical protein
MIHVSPGETDLDEPRQAFSRDLQCGVESIARGENAREVSEREGEAASSDVRPTAHPGAPPQQTAVSRTSSSFSRR